jgi:hypothetical protein
MRPAKYEREDKLSSQRKRAAWQAHQVEAHTDPKPLDTRSGEPNAQGFDGSREVIAARIEIGVAGVCRVLRQAA